MPIGPEALRLANELRITISDIVDTNTRMLVRSWAKAWDQIVAEVEAAALDLASSPPPYTLRQVLRAERAKNAVTAAQRQIARITTAADVTVTNAAGDVVDLTKTLEARMIAAQMPRTAGTTARLAVRFDRVSQEALGLIVERSTQQITSLLRPLSEDAAASMIRALTKAIPQGLSPRDAARRMVANAESGFNGGLTRAMTISRTEILDAYRGAAQAQQDANTDVLQGWVWLASLDDRTCPSCVGQAGTVHPLSEDGPSDHQNGRCSRMPLTKSWRDLGFGIDEPPSTVTQGADWFAGQPESTQLAIMGPKRLEAINSGRASVADMSTLRANDGWRSSFVPTAASEFAA